MAWIKLIALMAEKGINGNKLAELTGMHIMSISKLKNGKMNPSMDSVERIAEALGVEKKELF